MPDDRQRQGQVKDQPGGDKHHHDRDGENQVLADDCRRASGKTMCIGKLPHGPADPKHQNG